ncbi:MAG: hypothetical protein K0S74_788 [Chlamydiales bacterium]|jgi:SAM-dependent methyltransferase|nr:hypothetical protein [Chlamydiales bacterium]
MNFSSRIVPNSQEAKIIFTTIVNSPNEDIPIVEMNDTTARDMDVIWNSIEDIAKRWRGNSKCHIPTMPEDRKEFWGMFAQKNVPNLPHIVRNFVGSIDGKGKTAIDLGCGNGGVSEFLLDRGWRVIAVDTSRIALAILKERCQSQLQSGQLSVVEANLATYTPEEPAELVLAMDVFPYIDPKQFRDTWTKVHDLFIKEDGLFMGTFFRSVNSKREIIHMNMLKEMGAWFLPDRRMVRPLLLHVGYDVKTCIYRKENDNMEPMCIEFVARKISQTKEI